MSVEDDFLQALNEWTQLDTFLIVGARGQYQAKVSPEDYPFLSRWRWTFKRSRGGGIYARRGGGRKSDGELRPTILLHDVVMIELKGIPRPSPLHTVNHINADSPDCTRDNLEWATPREQIQHQWRNRRAMART